LKKLQFLCLQMHGLLCCFVIFATFSGTEPQPLQGRGEISTTPVPSGNYPPQPGPGEF